MGRKKLKRQYCIMVTIDGKEYYMATHSSSSTYGMRLVENPKSAYIIKTREKLEQRIENIILNRSVNLLLKGKIIATPDDYIELTINLSKEKFEEAKSKYKEAKKKIDEKDFLEDIPCPVKDIYRYSDRLTQFNLTAKDFKINFRNALSYYERYRKATLKKDELIKKNYKLKKVEFSILDASFDFRYSKLKKIIEKNDK